ncbi:MAG: family 16 glycoside hydrolase [bacterium]
MRQRFATHCVIAATLLLCSLARASEAQGAPAGKVVALDVGTGDGWHLVDRTVEHLTVDGRRAVRFDERPGSGSAWNSNVVFTDGEIEFDARGRDELQKSFVGVMFHAVSGTDAEIVYLRPFNFRAADSTRHAHAVQYTSYPVFSWEKLRAEHPGVYEKSVPPDLKPDDWVHVRVSVHGPDVRVYLNGSSTPVLSVQSLRAVRRGGVGLWVGDASNGDFANFTVSGTGAEK